MTKKALLEKMNGKEVVRTYLSGVRTIEDNEELKRSIIDALEENGKTFDDFVEDENTYSVKGFSNYWRKGKVHRETKGIFTIRSKDYIFSYGEEECCGTIPTKEHFEMLESGNGFIKREGRSVIKYELA